MKQPFRKVSNWASVLSVLLIATHLYAAQKEQINPVDAELLSLGQKVDRFQVLPLNVAPGEVVLRTQHSITIDQLRGIALDDDPPVLGEPRKPYDPRMTDDYPPGEPPYVARGVQPFRFKYFNCEFHYGGWHNFAMTDYAAAHGFSILLPYARKIDEATHLPEGTQWIATKGAINWNKWLEAYGIPEGRWDIIADLDLVSMQLDTKLLERPTQPQNLSHIADYLMIDMEHKVLPPTVLRNQVWYPRNGTDAQRRAFETKYYQGYAKTYISTVAAARRRGWRNISVYGWQPVDRIWWGLDKRELDPKTYQPWLAYGKHIYDEVDLINNSVYSFYWSPQNVAYTLANIDANMKFVNSVPVRKPVRPYFWPLLHGGGGGWRWWKEQPLPYQEMRAMTVLAFFTGIDGLTLWNWSGTENHHTIPKLPLRAVTKSEAYLMSGTDIMLKNRLALTADSAAEHHALELERYDVVHILGVDSEDQIIRFQPILRGRQNHGVGEQYPIYVMPLETLRAHARAKSEAVAAVIEGLALVKQFEYILRYGEVKIDTPAREQFADVLPIVRRVKHGKLHVLATYDPKVIYGDPPRDVVLKNFDGHAGLTLKLPADSETRIFVLEERQETSALPSD